MSTPAEWRARAACRDVDAELFFPTAERGPVHDVQVAHAKEVCGRCPVRDECLAEALVRIPYGVAGGLTPAERRGLRRPAAVSALVEVEPGVGAGRAERAATGRVLLAAGRPVPEVARRCGVAERTAARWAARLRATTRARDDGPARAEGSRGGNRAPLQVSRTQHPDKDTDAGEDRS